MKKGVVYLIPSVIAPNTANNVLPMQVSEIIRNTSFYIAETVRESRRFISSLNLGLDISKLQFDKVDKNTNAIDAEKYLKPALSGNNIGVFSDAGCPGVADPGAMVVGIAHKLGLQVIPLVGPSSLLLALMASGMNGQSFAFNGYLPIDQKEATQAILKFEKQSSTNSQTQLFIETPYRSDRTFELLVRSLNPHTLLCIARSITGENEFIKTQSVEKWKAKKITIGKEPTVFLFLSS